MKYEAHMVFTTEDGTKFDNEADAIKYCNENIIWNGYTISKVDIDKFKAVLETDGKDEFLDNYYSLVSTNSMGVMYPATVMKYIIDKLKLEDEG